jgi:hypothetical protein
MELIDPPPPGARVRIRGEEWAVEKTLPLPTGGHAIHVQGVSELVRYHQAIFLTPLDRDIVPLRAEDTRLVEDESPGYRQTALFLETLLRRTPPTHDRIAIGHRGALDVMPYQLVPAHEALQRLQPRILIADGTGLGKTVEIGIVLSELIKRGRGRRILVVAIRSMLAQLQRELWARFTLPLVRLDAEGITRVQGKIPAHRNPFSYFDRVIVSMDTLKNHGRYRAWLEEIRWDVIVVDECHNVANRGSQRANLARLLASQCDALILTSATPHNGKPESFANLMQMLDPTSIANPRSFTKEDVQHLFVRRFKKDVEGDAGEQLRDRSVKTHAVVATREEEAVLEALHTLTLGTLGRKHGRRDALLKWTLIKAFLSSPTACLESLDHRIAATRRALDDGELGPHPRAGELHTDLARLHEIRDLVLAAEERGFGKLARLYEELRAIGFDGGKRSPRVVIFSERIATLELLQRSLTTHFGMRDEQIGVFTARDTDEKAQRALVESFGHADSPLRVLLCSDAASEGVNLHHQCHHLFHFDVRGRSSASPSGTAASTASVSTTAPSSATSSRAPRRARPTSTSSSDSSRRRERSSGSSAIRARSSASTTPSVRKRSCCKGSPRVVLRTSSCQTRRAPRARPTPRSLRPRRQTTTMPVLHSPSRTATTRRSICSRSWRRWSPTRRAPLPSTP